MQNRIVVSVLALLFTGVPAGASAAEGPASPPPSSPAPARGFEVTLSRSEKVGAAAATTEETVVTSLDGLPLVSGKPDGDGPVLPGGVAFLRSEEPAEVVVAGRKVKARLIRWKAPQGAAAPVGAPPAPKEVRWWVTEEIKVPPFLAGGLGMVTLVPANCVRAEADPATAEERGLEAVLIDDAFPIEFDGRKLSGLRFTQKMPKRGDPAEQEFVLCAELPGGFYSARFTQGDREIEIHVLKIKPAEKEAAEEESAVARMEAEAGVFVRLAWLAAAARKYRKERGDFPATIKDLEPLLAPAADQEGLLVASYVLKEAKIRTWDELLFNPLTKDQAGFEYRRPASPDESEPMFYQVEKGKRLARGPAVYPDGQILWIGTLGTEPAPPASPSEEADAMLRLRWIVSAVIEIQETGGNFPASLDALKPLFGPGLGETLGLKTMNRIFEKRGVKTLEDLLHNPWTKERPGFALRKPESISDFGPVVFQIKNGKRLKTGAVAFPDGSVRDPAKEP